MILALSLALTPIGQVSQAPVDQCSALPAQDRGAPTSVSSMGADETLTITVSRTDAGCVGSRLQVLAYEPSLVEVRCEGVGVRMSEVRALTPWSDPSTSVQTHRDHLLVSLAEVASGPWPAMEVVLTPTTVGQATCTVVAQPARMGGSRLADRN